VTDKLAVRAGSAFLWQGIQHFGVKAIYLVRIPILARLLVPDDFGLMAIAIVAVGLLMQVTDFGMVPALVQRAGADDRHYDAAWTVGVLRALAVSVVVFIGAPLIARVFSEPRATGIIQVLALRPLIQATASIRVADLTRNLRFAGISALNLTEAVANAVLSITLAPFIGVWALVVGSLAGPACYSILSYVMVPTRPRLAVHTQAATSLLLFGRWIFLTGIVAMAGNAALNAVISRRLGTVELGLYFLSARIAFLPTELASELVGGVAFPFYARIQADSDKARRAFRVLLVSSAALLLPTVALLVALAPSLVEEILGPGWQGAAPIIRVISVASGLGLFVNSAAPIFKGVGYPSRITAFRAVQSAVLVALAWSLSSRFGVVGAASAWVPAATSAMIVGGAMLVRLFPGILSDLLVPIASVLAVSAVGGGAAIALDETIGGLAGLFVGGIVAGGLVASLLWRVDRAVDLNLRLIVGNVLPAASGMFGRTQEGVKTDGTDPSISKRERS
ncbi:MAG TPA: lipopolysaccharide biosynthesis protein, partial [Longimicrobiales bacterium]|nr:lipopolysaccharide biosynthesis protein [Longimicrobiales bacterium]